MEGGDIMSDQVLSLNNIGGGNLNKEFVEAYKKNVPNLKHGEKCSVTIKVEFSRIKDTSQMFHNKWDMKVATPSIKRASMCKLQDGQFMTEAPVEDTLEVLPFNKDQSAA